MMAGGKRKAPDGTTTQEIKEKQHQLTKQQESLDTCAHILSIFIARPDIYQTASAKKIREQIQFIQANPTKFPPVSGDYLPNDIEPIAVGDYSPSRTAISIPKLTPAYVSRLAKGESVLDESTPIFQVAAPSIDEFTLVNIFRRLFSVAIRIPK